ncbi:MAG: nitrous oxide reductase accessory protein NosL [Desulfococcaceae bacterium]
MRTPWKKFTWTTGLLLLFCVGASAAAENPLPPKPGPREKCPVCGMFVAKYPDWLAAVGFEDGHTAYFDGAKDMFKYLFDVKKYDPSRSAEAVRRIHVTEYYDMRLIPAEEAFFVIGSDVYGPMGRELIPLATAEDAATFSADHHGKRTVRFDEITPDLIETLD